MIIELQISEPWDLPAGLSPVLQLVVEDPQNDDHDWLVRVRSDAGRIEEAILSPRYEGQTLNDLRSGQVRVVNLVLTYGRNRKKEMLVGTARLLDENEGKGV